MVVAAGVWEATVTGTRLTVGTVEGVLIGVLDEVDVPVVEVVDELGSVEDEDVDEDGVDVLDSFELDVVELDSEDFDDDGVVSDEDDGVLGVVELGVVILLGVIETEGEGVFEEEQCSEDQEVRLLSLS